MPRGVKRVCYVGLCFLLHPFLLPLPGLVGWGLLHTSGNPSPLACPPPEPPCAPTSPRPWNLTIHGHLFKDCFSDPIAFKTTLHSLQ